MAVSKLSQITPAGSPPALTDQLVGVTGGTTDNLYTVQQIADTIGSNLITSDTTVTVSPSGNDSNPWPGPYLTVPAAVHAATVFNWNGFHLQIDASALTTVAGGFSLPALLNHAPDVPPSILGASGSPTSLTIDCTQASGGQVFVYGDWGLAFLVVKTDRYGIWQKAKSTLSVFDVGIELVPGLFQQGTVISQFEGASQFKNAGALTVTGSGNAGDFETFFDVDLGSTCSPLDGGTFVWNATAEFDTAWANVTNASMLDLSFGNITGSGAITGTTFSASFGSVIESDESLPGTLLSHMTTPGTVKGYINSSSAWDYQFNWPITGDYIPETFVPTTGGTVTIPAYDGLVTIAPAGTLASLTIVVPPILFAEGTKVLNILPTEDITSVTWTIPDSSIFTVSPPTSLIANQGIKLVAINPDPASSAIYQWFCLNTTVTGGGGGAVSSVSNTDGTLDASPTTGNVIVGIDPTVYANVALSGVFIAENGGAPTGAVSAGLANLGVGGFALADLTNGQGNLAFGNGALRNATAASFHVAIGTNALFSAVNTGFNVAIGSTSMASATTAQNTVAIGNQTNQLGDADRGVFIGSFAGINATGQYNTFIGMQCGTAVTSGAQNIIIGGNGGGSSLVSGSGNVFIGTSIDPGADVSDCIIIGTPSTPQVDYNLTTAGTWTFNSPINTKGYTVATLPTAGTAGRRAYVTDALAPTFLGTLTGGHSTVCPVFDNGTAWVAG